MHNGESSVDKIREIINQTFSNSIIINPRLVCEMSIINAINNELISKKDLLIAIQLEPDIFDSTTIKRMIDRGVLSFSDLEDIGIRGSILTKLSKGIIKNIPYIEPFKKLERSLKKYNMVAYKKLMFEYYPKLKKIHEEIKKDSDEYIKVATQNISGIREIKALGIKENINRRIYVNIENLFSKQKKVGVNESVYYALNNLCYFVIQFFILLTLGLQVFDGTILLASFVLIEKYIWRIDDVVESLSEFGVSFNKVTVSLKRIDEILNNKLYEDEKFGLKEINDESCEIEFKNVKFKYRKEDKDLILKGLTMKLEPNKKIAIVGKSGNGKSTLFNLLLRYFDSNSGTIKINGININVNISARAHLVYILHKKYVEEIYDILPILAMLCSLNTLFSNIYIP